MQITPRSAAILALAGTATVALMAIVAIAPWQGDSVADAGIQGDTDCSGGVNAVDALWVLRDVADAPPLPDCVEAGDVDCSGSTDEADVTAILYFAAGGEQKSPQGAGCPAIGQPLPSDGPTVPPTTPPATSTPPTPTATATVTVTPTPEPTATLGPLVCTGTEDGSLPSDPGGSGTPVADSYNVNSLFTSGYLGDAAMPLLEYAPIPGRPNEALVALQTGLIHRVALDGSFAPHLWGDVSDLVPAFAFDEQGLLALAFSPDYENDCRVYMYYTPGCSNLSDCQPTELGRWLATPDDLRENTHEVILQIPEHNPNHNGGHIAFDGDGYLYLSLGDGGGSGDPGEDGQDLTSLRGKVLRLDVSDDGGYAIPPNPPFADGAGPLKEEIFAYGFRNPFRMTIDPVTDDVWLGDVGQGSWEEVDLVESGGNYGWDCYEGKHLFADNDDPDLPCIEPFVTPRAEYDHGDDGTGTNRQAVTGGVVYRGDSLPELYGWYVYADYYSGEIFAVDPSTSDDPIRLRDTSLNISSFTLLADGEIAIVTYADGILQLVD